MNKHKFAKSRALKAYREDIQDFSDLTDDQTRELFRELKKASADKEQQQLKEQIAEGYYGFVFMTASTYTEIEHVLVDYVQEGILGLLEAVESYDVEESQSFLDFATPLIQAKIREFIEENPLAPEFRTDILPFNEIPKGK